MNHFSYRLSYGYNHNTIHINIYIIQNTYYYVDTITLTLSSTIHTLFNHTD
jgi:hypothetical protein